jgi:hypothetical protein
MGFFPMLVTGLVSLIANFSLTCTLDPLQTSSVQQKTSPRFNQLIAQEISVC